MFNYMAAYAPAFGMMGTVMGLVVMMSGFGGANVSGVEESTADKFAGLLRWNVNGPSYHFLWSSSSQSRIYSFAGKIKKKDQKWKCYIKMLLLRA